MTKISADIQKLEVTAAVELFDLDMGWGVFRFHAGTNALFQPVIWQGNEYSPMPIQAEGFELSSQGQFPRPRLRIANIEGVISQALQEHGDMVGAKLTRRRTLARYLDAVNFPGGNSEADPTAEFPLDIYFIDRKSAETRAFIEFELASSMDVSGVKLPRRQIIQNACSWEYRSADCGYTGAPNATLLDEPTDNPALDRCGKRLKSCKLRWGDTAVLPFGGFPAAGLVRA